MLVMVKPGEGCNWLSFCDLDNLLKNDNTHCYTTKLSSHLEASVFLSSCCTFQKEYELSFHALFAQPVNLTGN